MNSSSRAGVGSRVGIASALALAGAVGLGATGITRADLIAKVYDAILDDRPDEVEASYKEACGPAPPEACKLLLAVATWWTIVQDFHDKSLDSRFLQEANAAIGAAEAWTSREPKRAEAWFYLGASYGVRLQWRGMRGERFSAARDGKRVKDALERALALEPDLNDAWFGIGLYHYYADIMPAILKFLRFLMLLPGGNRAQGLAEMLRAHDKAEVLGGEADYQLQQVYLWYENQPDRALALLDALHKRYPHNPIFLERIAEIDDVYLHDVPASLAVYRRLLHLAERGQVGSAGLAAVRARLGLAKQWDALAETDRAIDVLKAVVDTAPSWPYGALAEAFLHLGAAYDRMGQRDAATAAYRSAIAAAPADDPDMIRRSANDRLQHQPDARRAEAYRLSLEGWRLVEGGSLSDAASALTRSLELNPNDPITRYRFGRLLQSRGETSRALDEFEQAISARPVAPAVTLAAAYLEAGRVLEASGNRSRAIEMYRSASEIKGAEPETREAASSALARLRRSTPPLEGAARGTLLRAPSRPFVSFVPPLLPLPSRSFLDPASLCA
jgi:tetratricopeptide (TPR) repeat protein